MGLLDRLMRSSVDRALKMQPRNVRRVADETRYASPTERPMVDEIRAAGRRLAAARFAVAGLGAVATRRESGGVTVTDHGVDLADLDARHLITWIPEESEPDARIEALRDALSSHADIAAVVFAHPPYLLAAAATGSLPECGSRSLADVVGSIGYGPVVHPGVWVVADGVIAAGADAVDAVARLEAAERCAQIDMIARRNDHG